MHIFASLKQQLALLVLRYLRFFARRQLRRHPDLHIIGVTGSAGKSSTRDAIYQVLRQAGAVKASFKANSESGIPLDILGLTMRNYSLFDWARVLLLCPWQLLTSRIAADFYVVEMGIDSPDSPKNMEFLLSIVRPRDGVFTSVAPNHAAAFDHLVPRSASPEQRRQRITQLIAAEKAKLITSLPKTGLALLNADDREVLQASRHTKAQTLTFGQSASADLRLLKHQLTLTTARGQQRPSLQSRFTFAWQSKKIQLSFTDLFLPAHYAYSLAPAILLGLEQGLSLAVIKQALETGWRPPAGRASVFGGRQHSLLIDSSYNASSMLDFVTSLKDLRLRKGRKLALLGDMRELGQSSKNLHQRLALSIDDSFSEIHLVGPAMLEYALPILEKNAHLQVFHHPSSTQAGQVLRQRLQAGDLLLVKGSQNTIFLEEAIKQCLAKPKQDQGKLCRQQEFWLQQK